MRGPLILTHHLKTLACSRGRLLDVLVFVSTLLFTLLLARFIRENIPKFDPFDGSFSALVGWLFLASFAAHTLGALLKRRPMHARWQRRKDEVARRRPRASRNRKKLSGSDEPEEHEDTSMPWPLNKPMGFEFWVWTILIVLHWLVFMMLFINGLRAVGISEQKFVIPRELPTVLLVLSALPTSMVVFSQQPPKEADVDSWWSRREVERAADLLLFLSILVPTLIWSTQVGQAEPRLVEKWDLPNFLLSLVLMALETFIFAVHYVSPRLIYLTEDYRNPGTYLTMALALLPVAIRVFFGTQHMW